MVVAEENAQEVMAVLSRLLGQDVTTVARVTGGRNNKVYEVSWGESQRYIAKFYPDEGLESRNRLHTEFNSLQFLWENGVECVPKPIAADADERCAVYEHIDGQSISSENASVPDIEQAVRFVTTLQALSSSGGGESLPRASEACFSVGDYFRSLETRLNQLLSVEGEGPHHAALNAFLEGDVWPYLKSAKERCKTILNGSNLSLATELEHGERTLSPSDFGFQNAIRRPNGQVVFIDFEYFGWDDPAKMISDFLQHPSTELNDRLKQRFWDGCLDSYADSPGVKQRINLVYPLCGLKWCLLLLNEFKPEFLRVRAFAHKAQLDQIELQFEQLAKARRIFQRVQQGNEPPF